MPEPSDPSVEIAKELLRQLPLKEAYADGFSPGFKQAGKLLEDTVKTVRLAFFPLQVLAASQDMLSNFLKKAAEAVPPNERIPPPTQILGPVLEGIKYEDEGSELWEMYANLLSNSMDSKAAGLAHPAFVTMVRQLAPDEARILRYLSTKPDGLHGRLFIQLPPPGHDSNKIESWETEDRTLEEELAYPDNFDLYFHHLNSLILLHQGIAPVAGGYLYEFFLSPLGRHLMQAVSRSEAAAKE